ncbi:MAG: hypothetical protein C0478_18045, partial [Planctomyces sp.]|nr:hypothetical protein [Planctomyces sp.]
MDSPADLQQFLHRQTALDICWWRAEDPWDESRFRQHTVHLLEGRLDAQRFLAAATSQQVVVDEVSWLSHPLAGQLAELVTIKAETEQPSEDSPKHLLGPLRRLTIALSSPDRRDFNTLQWQAASTVAFLLGEPSRQQLPPNVTAARQTVGGQTFPAELLVYTLSLAGLIATIEVSTGLPPRAWWEAVGPRGSLVIDGYLTPSLAAKPRFWIHNSQGHPRGVDF